MALKKNQKIGITIIIISLLGLFIFTEYKKSKVRDSDKFTIGVPFRISSGTSTGPMLEYKYYVEGELYEGGKHVDDEDFDRYRNRFYRVQYSQENPSWSQIFLTRPVIDTIAIKAAGFSLPKKKRNQFQEY